MRKLVILRGAMGAGKSTFIAKNGLSRFTLCADQIRLLFHAPELTIDGSEKIAQFHNQKVWNLLYYLLEERMKKGEFTIVDAIHASKEDFSVYKKLASKYRYRLYIIDFSNVSRETLYQQNENREKYKVVPKVAIDRVCRKLESESLPSGVTVYSPDDFEKIFTTKPKDFDLYERIHIIGDIHGCYTVLKQYFEQFPISPKDIYIFVGDYFDRGIENKEVYTYLTKLLEYDNVILLMGNHEDKLYHYACGDPFQMDYGIHKTIEQLEQGGITKSHIRGFMKRMSQLCYFTFRGKTYLVTHGGIPYFPNCSLDFYSTNSFLYGFDTGSESLDAIYHRFMCLAENKVYQIHGHLNPFQAKIDQYLYSYNLEGNIENGGDLRILDLNGDGSICPISIKNPVYNPNLKEEMNVYALIESLRKSKFVREKELTENISSFHFTTEAFYQSVWNSMTVKARGLFIHTQENRIVARSYDKFFKIGERKETNLENLKNSFCFPVSFYLKYNGFLGILSWVDGELFFASKTTNIGVHAENFKRIFYQVFNDRQIQAITTKMIEEQVSFVFEVIDPVNDPHIIKYDKEMLVLLDIISNKTAFHKLPFDTLSDFCKENEIMVKQVVYIAKNQNEFSAIYDRIEAEDYQLDGFPVEGFVLEDSNGFMVKQKSKYYSKWKYLRSQMEKMFTQMNLQKKDSISFTEPFLTYLFLKYKDHSVDVKQLNVIEEREQFLKEYEGKDEFL